MKTKHILLSLTLIILSGVLSACAGGAFASTSWPGITVNEDTVYVAYNQHIYAVNLSNGTERWRYPAEADNKVTFYADPEISPNGQLIAGSYDFNLYSINPSNGQLNWTFSESTDRYIGSSLAGETFIYAPSADNNLYAVDSNGNLSWKFAAGKPLWAKPTTDENCECVYLASMDQHVYAIDAQTGNQEWKSEPLGGAIVGTPAYSSEGRLYVGTFGNEMLALDTSDGRIIWRTNTDGWVWSGPALDDSVLYFGDLSGNLYSVNAEDGSQRWKIKPDDKIVGTPLIVDDMIVFTTEADSVYAFDKEGNQLWRQAIGGKIYASPVSAGDLILVAPIENDNNSVLVALAKNGTQTWQFSPEQ